MVGAILEGEFVLYSGNEGDTLKERIPDSLHNQFVASTATSAKLQKARIEA